MKKDEEHFKNRLYLRIYLFCMGFFLLLAIFSAALVHAQSQEKKEKMEKLWQKTVKYMSQTHWIPGKVIEHEQTFNRQGEMVEETHAIFSLKPVPQRKVELYVESAEENGKDVTAEARRKINGVLTLADALEESPFTAKAGQSLTADFNGQFRQIQGIRCAGFDFTFINDDMRLKGIAWVSENNGLPLEITSNILSVPFTKEGVEISSYQETEYYTITADGHSKLEKSAMELDIEFPKMCFKGRVTTITTSRDHWLPAMNP